MNYLENHEYPSNINNEQKRQLSKMAINYLTKHGYLFKKNKNNVGQPYRVITLQDKEKLLYNYHTSPLGGHFGIKKTIETIKQKYYWPDMYQDIRNYIETCDQCQRIGRPKTDSSIIPIKVNGPFEQIRIDFVGPLKESSKGNKYIIVATDYLTKWPEAKPVPNATAMEVAKFLYEDIICRHGVPTSILSDHGPAFIGKIIKLLKEEVGFKHKFSAPYHPQTNGLTEKFNGTLCKSLLKCVNSMTAEWDDLIPSVLFAYRTTKHTTTKYSPFYLLNGYEAQLPIDLELNKNKREELPYEEMINQRVGQLIGIFTDALILSKDNINSVQQAQIERTKRIEGKQTFKENDLVILYDAAKQTVHGDKFTIRWLGPYYIQQVLGKKTVTLRDKNDPAKISSPISTTLIKHYKQRELV
jgi:hypothetical protein